MIQIFKKPDLNKKERQAYLIDLESKILLKEKELDSITLACEALREKTTTELCGDLKSLTDEIERVENVLKIKRSERVELDKPYISRIQNLDGREQELNQLLKSINEKEQSLFEREHVVESKLEGLKDLSDELGEARIRCQLKEKTLSQREDSLKRRESIYLANIEQFRNNERNFAAQMQKRESEISLREFNVESRTENQLQREKQLSDGFILLKDQRETLGRAWKELEKKKYG